MADDLKVTVVATGLGRAQEQQEVRLVSNGGTRVASKPAAGAAAASPATAAATKDYSSLDVPPAMRQRAEVEKSSRITEPGREPEQERMRGGRTGTDDMDFLDIPAFLRRQAD